MKRIFCFLISVVLLGVSLSSCADVNTADSGVGREIPADTTDLPIETVPQTLNSDGAVETAETQIPQTTQTAAPETVDVGGEAIYRPKVFMYHLIREEVYGIYDGLFVRPSEFDKQLSILDELGYEYLYANEWRMTSKPSVIITLDDGYSDNYTEMLPILQKHGAKATVFVVTDLMGQENYMTRDQVRAMADSGCVSIQSHTAHHNSLSGRTPEDLRADFKESIDILESITGQKISSLAYPAGEYDDTTITVAREFFNFAYTTQSPAKVTEYESLTIPRYAVYRGCTEATFRAFVSY